jgi:O-antigen/teichoic acid export membrane protein
MKNVLGADLTDNQDQGQTTTRARRLFKNFGFLTVGRALGDAFTFLLFVGVSRAFGQEGLGHYSFGVAFTGFFVVVAESGLYPYSIKELSRHAGPLGRHYGRILSLRLILSLLVFLILLLAIPFVPFSLEAKIIIALVGLNRLLQEMVNGFAAVFVASEEMHLAGFLQASLGIFSALAGIIVLIVGGSLSMVMVTLVTVSFLQLFVAYYMVTRKHGRPILDGDWPTLRQILREILPYALSKFLAQLYSRTDVVILGFLVGSAAAGLYNAAYRVVFIFLLVPYFAAMALFPLASRLFLSSKQELKALYHSSLSLTILLGVPVTVGLWLVAPQLIDLLYGEEFVESVLLLRVLAGLTFLATLKSIMGVFLMSCDRQAHRARSQAVSAFISVVGNLLLITFVGIKGAAFATLLAEIVLVVQFAIYLRPVLGWPQIGSRLVMSGVAAASFFLLFTLLVSAPLLVVIPISMLIYLVVLLAFGDIRRKEAHMIKTLLRGERGELLSAGQEIS